MATKQAAARNRACNNIDALLKLLSAQNAARRNETQFPTWADAETAAHVLGALLEVAAMTEYDETTPENTVKERVLAAALDMTDDVAEKMERLRTLVANHER